MALGLGIDSGRFGGSGVDRSLVAGTALSLLALPVFAAQPWAWPGMVGLTLVASVGLVLVWRQDPLTTQHVLWGALILRLAFLPLLPGLSDDFYRYIWDGWVQMEGINPYRFVPEHKALSAFQAAPLYEELNSQEYYTVYPPFSQLAFALGGAFYSIDWLASYYVLKVLFAAAEFGGVLLLSRLISARNLLLYAWNPLVLIETAGQGHTEALMMPFLVGLIWAVRRNSGRYASLAVAGAGMIKLYPFVLWPYLVRRFGRSAIWPGVVLMIGVTLPYAAPYMLPHLKSSVDLFAHLMEFNAGPYYLVKHIMWLLTGADWSKVIGPIFRYLFLVTLPILYYLDWKRDWSFRWAALLTIGLFLVLSTTVHPWYFLPVLAFGVIYERPAWPWFWVAALSVGTYLFYIDGSYWTWIILGWGGGTLLGAWMYREELRDTVREVRAGLSESAPAWWVGSAAQSDSK